MRYVITTYVDEQTGWVPVKGSHRSLSRSEAGRLARIMRRADPENCYKAQALTPPQLPSFL